MTDSRVGEVILGRYRIAERASIPTSPSLLLAASKPRQRWRLVAVALVGVALVHEAL